MHRLICKLHDVDIDVAAPYLPQLMSFIKNSTMGMKEYLHAMAKNINRPLEYIVDVGACVGSWTLSFATIFPDAEVLAIEPSKYNHPYLVRNTESFSQVKTVKLVMAHQEVEIGIANPTPIQRDNKDVYINTGLISIYGSSEIFREYVQAKRLDDVVEKRVDWLKIDVEGGEIEVLKGAQHTILSHRPIIQVEMKARNQAMSKRNCVDLHGLVTSLKYTPCGGLDADWIYRPL